MRARLATWLRRLAEWLAPLPPPVPLVPPDLLARARELVQACDSLPHTGAFKRAQAFKQLLLAFPKAKRRDLGLAIELAVREVL